MENRQEILDVLKSQYLNQYSMKGYPQKIEASAILTSCNVGSIFMIVGNAGDSAIVWGDWGDNVIDKILTECEIEYVKDQDDRQGELKPAIKYGETYFNLDLFIRI